jgi:hypothetical protein
MSSSPPSPPNLSDARTQLKRDIISCLKKRIIDFYALHPEWLDDERSHANIDSYYALASTILSLLDNYEIAFRIPS